MTHQEYRERLDEILKNGIAAYEGGGRLFFQIDQVEQAIDRLFLDAVGEDDAYDDFCSECSDWDDGRNDLRQQLRTTITGKEGGDE